MSERRPVWLRLPRTNGEAWASELALSYNPKPVTYQKWTNAAGRVLHWLNQFPGGTWDERWLASGLDQAPREGYAQLGQRLGFGQGFVGSGVSTVVRARLVRPSYEWMFSSNGWLQTSDLPSFLEVSEPAAVSDLRALPQYQRGHELVRRNAESAISRVLLRTVRMGT